MADATFITAARVEARLSSLTTARLPTAVDAQRLADACRRVVDLIKGTAYEVPTEADAPNGWKLLATDWLCAQMAQDFPEYFRFDGAKRLEEVETRIARTARIEPTENKTHTRSAGSDGSDDWDYDCGGILS